MTVSASVISYHLSISTYKSETLYSVLIWITDKGVISIKLHLKVSLYRPSDSLDTSDLKTELLFLIDIDYDMIFFFIL